MDIQSLGVLLALVDEISNLFRGAWHKTKDEGKFKL